MKGNLPRHYLITGENPQETKVFLEKLESHFAHGISLVQLRAKNLSLNSYRQLAEQAVRIAKRYDKIIILNTDPETAMALNANGVHITSDLLMQLTERPIPKDKYLSAACHNAEQLKKAASIGADFVTLSPVLPTRTHPDAVPLGWDKFRQLCAQVRIPIFALGGLLEDDLQLAIKNGGQGIAAINSLWNKQYSEPSL